MDTMNNKIPKMNIDWQMTKTNLTSRMKELYYRSQWTDCAFRVGDSVEVFKAHKIILAASSPVFEALFFGSLANTEEFVNIPDVVPDAFRKMIEYIYYDKMNLTSIESAGQILYAAKKYIIPHLSRMCIDFILERTTIKTIPDVLVIGEDLDELELLNACIKLMCQYPASMWVSSCEPISLVALKLLLEQSAINMMEVELWQLVMSWAAKECHEQKIAPTTANKRAVIDRAGLLRKVRFLTISPNDFSTFVANTGLLSKDEVKTLRNSLPDEEKETDLDRNIEQLRKEKREVLPIGFSAIQEVRKRYMAIPSRAFRLSLSKKKGYSYGGIIKTNLSVDTRVLVTGFEVFTRIASSADFLMSHGSAPDHYLEDLSLSISDASGKCLNKTTVSGLSTAFNVAHGIMLSDPVWFETGSTYAVRFELENGQYPLSDLSPYAFGNSVTFNISHCEQVLQEGSVKLEVSFINGIFFTV